MRKLTIHLDAVVVVTLVLAGSLGLNAWQLLNGRKLMQDYVDTEWALGDARANMVHARTLLKACDPDRYRDLDVRL